MIVFRDGAWGLVREAQKRLYHRTPFTDISCPDLELMAKSLGMRFAGITRNDEIEDVLEVVAAASEPVLVDLRVSDSEAPPYVRGAGEQMFRRLPLRTKINAGLRLLRRRCFEPGRGNRS